MIKAVNLALHLKRPLLLTGRPGSGKSSLIEAVASELKLGEVIRWHITSRSNVTEGCYRYDAIGRLHMHSLALGGPAPKWRRAGRKSNPSPDPPPIENFLRLGPLGTALAPRSQTSADEAGPRALLIDEIDKGDIDLPNDLLNIFERGEFEIPELTRMKGDRVWKIDGHQGLGPFEIEGGRVRCSEFPFVVMTSNGERDFPAAFLRRCIRLEMPAPDKELLERIVSAWLSPSIAQEYSKEIADFAADATSGRKPLATDQLLNYLHVASSDNFPEEDRPAAADTILKPLHPDRVSGS